MFGCECVNCEHIGVVLTEQANVAHRVISRIALIWREFVVNSGHSTEPRDFPFTFHERMGLARFQSGKDAGVDDQTWDDLDIEQLCRELGRGFSIFGKQRLYSALRHGKTDSDLQSQRERIEYLREHGDVRHALREKLTPLRDVSAELTPLLFCGQAPQQPWWGRWASILPMSMAACVAGLHWSWFALVPALVLFVTFLVVQTIYHVEAERWEATWDAVKVLLRVSVDLGKVPPAKSAEERYVFGPLSAEAVTALRGFSALQRLQATPTIRAYADWYLLRNITAHWAAYSTYKTHERLITACYFRVSELELDVLLTEHLLRRRHVCWTTSNGGQSMCIRGLVHPFLPDAHPLDVVTVDRSLVVMGQNGVGKSTLIRAIGFAAVLGRAFGFCYAAEASLPKGLVFTSIRQTDLLTEGTSLYMAEVKRAKSILDRVRRRDVGVCLFDEIFSGTNHSDGVAAAAAVLEELARFSLIIATTHNVELAPLLVHDYDVVKLVNAGDSGELQLLPGILAETNGLSMLTKLGLDPAIEQRARFFAAWLSRQMASERARLLADESTMSVSD